MAELIDPDTLKSVAQIAKMLGYSPNYLAELAAKRKFKAWRIGNTWASTYEIVAQYAKASPPPGRPKRQLASKRHKPNTRNPQN